MAANNLTGQQKAAIMLLSLGEDGAAAVLQHLAEDEIELVSRFMTQIEQITPADVDRVCNEYYIRTEKGVIPPVPIETKSQYLHKVLTKAVGDSRTEELMQGMFVAPPGSALEKLQWHAPRSVANFIAKEHPQVVAVILATMDEPGLAQKVLAALPASMQKDVVERIAGLQMVSRERIRDIEETLNEAMTPEAIGPYKEDSGAHRVAEVLNTGSLALEKSILNKIEDRDPEMAERIRDEMLRFEDFLQMDNPGLQKVLNRSTLQDIVLAMRTASDPLREYILANVSINTAKQILEELEGMGPTRVAEIEAAQQRLTMIARDMVDKGQVRLLGKDAAQIVS